MQHETTHNSLIHSTFTPPLWHCVRVSYNILRRTLRALPHTCNPRAGRAFLFLLVAASPALLLSCNSDVVSNHEYEALFSCTDSLAARCVELEIEVSDLKMYNDYLEAKLDSCEALEEWDLLTEEDYKLFEK